MKLRPSLLASSSSSSSKVRLHALRELEQGAELLTLAWPEAARRTAAAAGGAAALSPSPSLAAAAAADAREGLVAAWEWGVRLSAMTPALRAREPVLAVRFALFALARDAPLAARGYLAHAKVGGACVSLSSSSPHSRGYSASVVPS